MPCHCMAEHLCKGSVPIAYRPFIRDGGLCYSFFLDKLAAVGLAFIGVAETV